MSSSVLKTSYALDSETLLGLWDALVARDSATPALIEAASGRVFSRGELDRLASEWVRSVSTFLAPKGSRIAFALPNGASWLTAFLGILRAGGVPLPIDASEPPAAQIELSRVAGCGFFWTGTVLQPVERAEPASASANAGLCVIKLTSGSTGRPRALAFKDSEMIADGRQICAGMDLRPTDLNLAIVPFGHSYGLGNLLMPLLIQGTAVLCVSAPLPQAIAQDCARWHPTAFPAVPALLRVLTMSDLPNETFSSVRTVISAGSPLSAETAQAFFQKYQRLVHSFYGSSETGGIAYDRSGEATLAGRGIGMPLNGVSLHFGPGQRFYVESAAVYTRGNRGRSSAGLGKHRPADRAELTPEGELRLLGRTGRMFKIAGRRIDLAELENTVRKLPGVQDAFFSAHPEKVDELAGAVASANSLEEIRALLRRELAPWKLPKRLVVLTHFPLTGRGKTDTAALRRKLGGS